MKKLLFLLSVLSVTLMYAQTDDNGQEGNQFNYDLELSKMVTIPNSPEAEAFTKYGNTQVNMYTGTPDISAPIHVFKGRELDLPISLTYDATGIKVEQLATQAGLGWNLNAGGRISRIINGHPDDFNTASGTYLSFMNDDNVQQKMLDYIEENQTFPTQQAVIDYLEFLNHVNEGFYETQPDYFSLNVPGLNDHLVFDVATRQAKALNNPRLKISFTQDLTSKSVTGWTVTHDNGTVYHFAQAENTYAQSTDIGPGVYGIVKDYNSSWVLTKIESPNKKDIYEFTYASLDMWPQPQPASLVQMVRDEADNNMSANNYGINLTPSATTDYQIDQLFLTEISYKSGALNNEKKIVSVDLKNRDDLDIASAIDRINLHRLEDGQVYRYFVFEHSYFGNAASTSMLEKRLKLDALSSYSALGTVYQRYGFEYINPDGVPSRISLGQDYLGYYNGANNNTVLYPPMEIGNDTYAGANRNPQFSLAKTGLLNKITYPTGGITRFEYEPHKTPYNNSDLAEEEPQTVVYGGLTLIGGTDSATVCGGCCMDQYGDKPKVVHQIFNITEAGSYKLSYSFSGMQGIMADGYLFYRGLPASNKTFAALPYEQIIGWGCEDLVGLVWQNAQGGDTTVNLQPGNYQITLVNKSGGDVANLQVYRDNVILPTGTAGQGEVQRAGIRVQSITDYTQTGQIAQRKSYRYKTTLDGNTASGEIIFDPVLIYTTGEQTLTQSSPGEPGGVVTKTVYNRVAGSSGGERPHVAYSRVYEIVTSEVGGTPVGYTEYNFNTGSTGIYSFGGSKSANYYLINSEVGKQSEINVYDDQQQIQSKQNFTYDQHSFYLNKGIFIERKGEYALKFPVIKPVVGGYSYELYDPSISGDFKAVYPQEVCNNNPDYLCMTTQEYSPLYYWETSAGGKVGTTVSMQRTDYFDSQDVTTTTSYEYSDVSIDHLLRETVTTSSGTNDTLRVRYYYPKDANVDGAGLLEQQNRLSEVVKTETFVNDEQTMIRQQDYAQINAGVLLPVTITTQKEASDPEERMEFSFYGNGNLKEAFRPDGSISTFIWGYQHTLPIAKLDGISYADIDPATILSLQSLSDNDIDVLSEQTLVDALAVLYDDYPDASITTFTYDPLVGLTGITDPKGYTSFYNYDNFNRLVNIKDADGNVLEIFDYNYGQETPPVFDPLSADISYGSAANDHQWFSADLSGGSGDYSYGWFEGTGNSSTDFEGNASGTSDTYQLMVNCSDTKYVKLLVTDNVTGETVEATKINNNACPYPPLIVNVVYGTHNDTWQNFVSMLNGGSGNVTYAWYKGIGTSSFTFEVNPSGALSNYQLSISCATYKWVKLVVTDTVTGESVNKVIKSNNSPCSGGGGTPPGPDPFDPEQ